jgi:hypothetical protein
MICKKYNTNEEEEMEDKDEESTIQSILLETTSSQPDMVKLDYVNFDRSKVTQNPPKGHKYAYSCFNVSYLETTEN